MDHQTGQMALMHASHFERAKQLPFLAKAMQSPSFYIHWFLSFGYLLLTPSLSLACLWIHGTTLDGHYATVGGFNGPQILIKSMAAKPEDNPRLFDIYDYKPESRAATANDEAVQMLLKGDAKKAVKRLEEIEAKYPGNYYTAANRGTALELTGENEEALKWILEGISRNPDSHMRTEWLHARILEAKIHMKAEPDWLKTHTITGIDVSKLDGFTDPVEGVEEAEFLDDESSKGLDSESRRDTYVIESAQGPQSPLTIRRSLQQQLSVRMLLVKPTDPFVAQLLIELAHLESRLGIQEHALEYLDLAVSYGADPEITATFRAELNGLIGWHWLYMGLYPPFFWLCVAVCFLVGFTVLSRINELKKQKKELAGSL